MHLAPFIRDLALILAVAGLMSLVFNRIRQPVVLGYIIAGIIVGPHTPPFQLVTDLPSIQTWAELGVIFLMFSLGLEFSFRKLARVGGSAAITAGMEVLFFLPVGYGVGKFFGWKSMDSIFLGAMLAISSTTIIIKALDELKLKTRRFAELIFAVLIVEDLLAILLLVALSTIATSESVSAMALLMAGLKLVLVVGGWFIAGYFVVPRLMRHVGRVGNNEMITLVSIGLCLALVVFATHFHYSTALGAFIMGSILAETPLLHRIEERMDSLRDLFGAIFFVSIGMLIDPRILLEHWREIAILCTVTITGKIFSTSLGAIVSGQTFRNSLQVGFGLAQIGEFSFIIAGLGLTLGATSSFLYPIAVAVSLVTTFTTPYLIRLSGPVAIELEKRMPASWLEMLNRYAVWSEQRKNSPARDDQSAVRVISWLINGLTISILFVLSGELLLPRLAEKENALQRWAHLIAWFTAALASSPFIWGMLSAAQKYSVTRTNENSFARTAAIIGAWTFTLVWIAILSAEFFPGKAVVVITLGILLVAFGLFYQRLEKYYRWYEKRFLSAFEKKSEKLKHLAPWDVHFVTLEVHPNTPLVGKRLSEAQLRTRRGVNVVAIQRGHTMIVAPKPDELIFPHDELIVLGTDEQVEAVRTEIEDSEPVKSSAEISESSEYQLRQVRLSEQSAFIGQTIRQSGMREKFQAMVVGLERGGVRDITPDSDLTLLAGDQLWIVGNPSELMRLVPLL